MSNERVAVYLYKIRKDLGTRRKPRYIILAHRNKMNNEELAETVGDAVAAILAEVPPHLNEPRLLTAAKKLEKYLTRYFGFIRIKPDAEFRQCMCGEWETTDNPSCDYGVCGIVSRKLGKIAYGDLNDE